MPPRETRTPYKVADFLLRILYTIQKEIEDETLNCCFIDLDWG